jgi:hypothetical protein
MCLSRMPCLYVIYYFFLVFQRFLPSLAYPPPPSPSSPASVATTAAHTTRTRVVARGHQTFEASRTLGFSYDQACRGVCAAFLNVLTGCTHLICPISFMGLERAFRLPSLVSNSCLPTVKTTHHLHQQYLHNQRRPPSQLWGQVLIEDYTVFIFIIFICPDSIGFD